MDCSWVMSFGSFSYCLLIALSMPLSPTDGQSFVSGKVTSGRMNGGRLALFLSLSLNLLEVKSKCSLQL